MLALLYHETMRLGDVVWATQRQALPRLHGHAEKWRAGGDGQTQLIAERRLADSTIANQDVDRARRNQAFDDMRRGARKLPRDRAEFSALEDAVLFLESQKVAAAGIAGGFR